MATTTADVPRLARRIPLGRTLYNQRYLYLLILPSFVFVFIFNYMPIYGIIIAFKQYHPLKGIWGSAWVGFKHFTELFNSLNFSRVLANTLIINVYYLVFGFPAPIILALLMNELRGKRFKSAVQTITYLPHFLSWVIVGTFVVSILSPTGGLINQILKAFGQKPTFFLLEPDMFRSILIASSIWKEIGWGSILYLAALSTIDPTLYEAALTDGAGRWKQTLHITLPGIQSTITILLILRFSNMLASNFEQVFILYNPSVYRVGDVISTYIYRIGLGQAKYSETAALGLFNSVLGFILVVSGNYLTRKYNEVSMW